MNKIFGFILLLYLCISCNQGEVNETEVKNDVDSVVENALDNLNDNMNFDEDTLVVEQDSVSIDSSSVQE